MDTILLPFSEFKQDALLGHILTEDQFFQIIKNKIQPEWFLSQANAKIYWMYLKFRHKYIDEHKMPTHMAFRECNQFLELDPKDRNILFSHIGKCLSAVNQIPLYLIKPDLTEWLHSVILMTAMKDANRFYNNKDIKQCYQILTKGVKEVQTTAFDGGKAYDFRNPELLFQEAEIDRKDALTTGLKILDESILDGAIAGGLKRSDTTVFIGASGAGKTTTLITIAAENIRQSKDVLFMTHEGGPRDIQLKFISNAVGCSIRQLFELNKNNEGRHKIEQATINIDKHLKYIPYNKAGMTIEEVIPIIRISQEERIAQKENGKGFDLLISDYPALLTTEQARQGHFPKRLIDQIVYGQYVQLALEYQFHSLLAIQTNREGARINRGHDGETSRLITPEDVSESYGPIQQATNVITINRSEQATEQNMITYYIGKSRGNQAGVRIVADSNFAANMSHSNAFRAVRYIGQYSHEQAVQQLLSLHQTNSVV